MKIHGFPYLVCKKKHALSPCRWPGVVKRRFWSKYLYGFTTISAKWYETCSRHYFALYEFIRVLHSEVCVCMFWCNVATWVRHLYGDFILNCTKPEENSYSCRSTRRLFKDGENMPKHATLGDNVYDNVRASCETGTRKATHPLDGEYWREF